MNDTEEKALLKKDGAFSMQTQPAPSLEKPPKKDLVQSAKEFFGNALGATKNRDLNQLVEEFTAEMTLVAEGLSEDQARLSKIQEELSAQQTLDQQKADDRAEELLSRVEEQQKRLDKLEKSLAQLQKTIAEKKIKKVEGLTGLMRQATWLVAIAAGAWVVVTILRFFQ